MPLPQLLATLPPDLKIKPLFDQSIFVRASIEGVLKEAVIAACLTALMILLFSASGGTPSLFASPFRCRS